MDTLDDFYTKSTNDRLDTQRDIIRESLDEIANDIGMAMRDERLHFPVYITVRNSGTRSRQSRRRSTHQTMTGHVRRPSSAMS